LVVIVAEALAGALTVAGLTVHAGGSVKVVGITWQLRLTVPVKPLTDPTVTIADEVPSGGTATGENADASRVKLCADAAGKVKRAASRHRAATATWTVRWISVDCDGLDCNGSDVVSSVVWDCEVSDFNMSRFWFK